MSLFPTQTAMRLAKSANIHKLTHTEFDISDAMRDFQRMSALSSFEDALFVFESHLKDGKNPNKSQHECLELIHRVTQLELNGIVLDHVGNIMSDSKSDSTKLDAAKLIHAIKNGEDVDESKVKKIIFELDKGE